jgi:rhomboid protease GluP
MSAAPPEHDPARAASDQAQFDRRLREVTPRTFMTPLLVAINVLVFVAMAADGAGIVKPEGEVHVRWGSNFGLMTASGEWWRLFTSMFLHFGVIHLALNMAALWDFGRLAERLFGNWTFLAIYLLAGISGAMASLLWHPSVNSAGASGAVFGVFGMVAGYLVHKELGVPLSVIKRHWGVTLPFIGYNLFIGATVPGIDNAAHVGGLAAGLALGYVLARPLDAAARKFSTARLAILGVAAIACASLLVRPLGAVAENARAELGVHEAIQAVVRNDDQSSDEMKKTITGLESGRIAPEQAARRIREVVARYEAANKRLASFRLRESSHQWTRHETLVRYTALRAEGYELLAQAVLHNDEAALAKSRARIQEGNALVKSLSAPQR